MTKHNDLTQSILLFGDPRLSAQCKEVNPLDKSLIETGETLLRTIHAFRQVHGWGRAIAAPQVGVLERIVAMTINGKETVLLNPRITWHSPVSHELWDDCMSLPQIAVRVLRLKSVTVEYTTLDGTDAAFERAGEDLSELLQHEIDHLDGVLMTDRQVSSTPLIARKNREIADLT
ncbi:MAG: formylmethionine deformylase [Hyphomicrobiales bacterium]|nr:MAG: formylmethionine deformylase [Hyphomicrobiales bacterium]